jgi:hypothetical protein
VDTFWHYLQVKAFSRGLRGYHSAWVVIGVALWMINRVRHHDDVVYRTELKPGERLVVTTSRPAPKTKSAGR